MLIRLSQVSTEIQAGLATQASVDVIDGIVDAILADTNELQTDWVNGGRLDLILDARASQASVDDLPTNAELVTALAAADDAVLAAVATVDGIVDTLLVTSNKLDDTLEDDAGTYRFTTNALEQAPSGGGSLTAADVWSYATRILTAGTNIVLAKGTGVTGFNDLSAAQVNTEVDTAISDAALATAANLATVAGYLDTEIAAILADTNELQTDWTNGGRLDLILDGRASQTSVDDLPTNAELSTALASADDAVLAAVATVDSNVDAILEDTGTTLPATLATIAGYIDTEVAAIKAKTDNLPAAPAATGDIPTANQNADALLDRADAMGTGLTLRKILRGIGAALLGKVSGAGTASIVFRDVNDSKNVITATVDEDGNRSDVTTDLT
jgi:hypothetical protein